LKVEKRIHEVWKEVNESRSGLRQVVGKYQYVYTSKKDQISLIELPDYFRDGKDLWEIYSLKGDAIEDTERFNSKEDADKRIKEILD